jgi:hypothetical protein
MYTIDPMLDPARRQLELEDLVRGTDGDYGDDAYQ